MSEVTGGRSGSAPSRVLPPAVILLLGLVTTAVCMLLLFGPFYPEFSSPGMTARRVLFPLTEVLPTFFGNLLRHRFFLLVLVVFGVVLALVPWLIAAARQRARRGRTPHSTGGVQVTRTERNVSLSFADDGSIGGIGGDDGGDELTRSVADLQMMARAYGVPWHADYETAGGARAFLEVLRAVHTGPAGVVRAEDHPRTRAEGPQAPSSAVPAVPAKPAERQAAASPVTEPAPTLDGAEGEGSGPAGGYRTSQPTWSSSFTGSVYTSTDLYSSERTSSEGSVGRDASDTSDDPIGSDDSDDRAGER